jgi:hypothetical protein
MILLKYYKDFIILTFELHANPRPRVEIEELPLKGNKEVLTTKYLDLKAFYGGITNPFWSHIEVFLFTHGLVKI